MIRQLILNSVLVAILVAGTSIACNEDDPEIPSGTGQEKLVYAPEGPLQELAAFPLGMIVSAQKLSDGSTSNHQFRDILLKDYTSITAENDMKMANIFTGPGSYDFSDGDAIIAFAKQNNLRVHGHTLIWHQSVPGWLRDFTGTDEEFTTLIENYVKATVSHFASEKISVNGREVSVLASWDVVNEVFDGADWRETVFRERMGPDYVSSLFTWAREADPDVLLFYNDYNVAGESDKRRSILNMLAEFKENGVPVDGLGFQMHVNYDWPSRDAIEESVLEAAATGLQIHFSELDIKVNDKKDINALTAERAALQEAKYREVAETYFLVPEAQRFGITTWGMRDSDSWLYRGGTEWPLMYTQEFGYKIAHRGFAEGLASGK